MNELEQVHFIQKYMFDNIEPLIKDALPIYLSYNQKYLYENKLPNKKEMEKIILTASHFGSLIRETYYNFVYKGPCKQPQFWNATISVFVLTGYWRQYKDFNVAEKLIKSKEYKKIIKYMSFPKWVELGLTGGEWSKIRKMCKQYCKMRDIKIGSEVKIKRGKDKGDTAIVIDKLENKFNLKIGNRTKQLSLSSVSLI
jgi:hypothetical protein